MDVDHKRSIILAGHSQAGKTTLAESMLFICKTTTRKGSVADGTTVSDYSSDEIESKHSINDSLLYCDYKGFRIQMIDSPGYADFFGEVLAGMRATDAAIIVVDASGGIEVGTERAWQQAEECQTPAIFFINKSDKPQVDISSIIRDIQARLSARAFIFDDLSSPELIEAAAESDDALLEKYLEKGELTADEERVALTKAVRMRKVFPVFTGAALLDKGVADLLEGIIVYLPSPLERVAIPALDPGHPDSHKAILPSESGHLCGFVFKNISDPYVGQMTLLRIYSGVLAANTGFYNATRGLKERIGHMYILQGKEQRSIDSASCGDIVALAKLKDIGVSDSVCDDKECIILDPLHFPEPAISASVKSKSRDDEEKVALALQKLAAEDPTFHVSHDPQTKELIISGLGDVHLGVMTGRMKKRFNVDVELGTPRVSYRETIRRSVKVQGKFKRQSGGRGQYGDVWIEIQPLESGRGIEFLDKIVGGAIPRNYIPSVEKGVRQAAQEGAAAGYPIVDVLVRLYDGSYHDVDSSDMAFQIAGAMALRKAVIEAGPVLLEPVMDIEITIPEDYLGAVSGDINGRRGRIMGMDVRDRIQVVRAQAPQSEMFKYSNDLRSMTGGRGMFTMKYSHYEEVPPRISAPIISAYQATRKHEE
jgi:elongation factor G